MSSLPRFVTTANGRLRRSGYLKVAFVGAIAALSGACSADIARFDFPAVALSEPSTGALPVPPESVSTRQSLGGEPGYEGPAPEGGDRYAPPSASRPESRVDVSALPEPADTRSPAFQPTYAPPASTPPVAPAPASAFAPSPAGESERGEEIVVQRGDTLYGLSRRHRVSLNELMRVNGLTSPALQPGQKLVLPVTPTQQRAAPRPQVAAIEPAPAPSDWAGTYTVQRGDSLYAIARRHNVKFTDLQRYNGISDVRRVMPGTVLKVPGQPTTLAEAVTSDTPADTPPASLSIAPPVVPPVTSDQAFGATPAAPAASPTILNAPRPQSEQKVAELDTNTASDASVANAPASGSVADTGKLRWPVKGRIVAGFGPRSDGTHNDGINIAVPLGTDVHAAEAGTVAYAGNELKGYGNLLLVRHDNGWVTAYAHADRLMVKRGDRVTRGQVIAKAGRTGQVDQPQLHFEVRHGQKPVDPAPYLESR